MVVERMRTLGPSSQHTKKFGSKRIKTVREGRVVEQKMGICGPKIPVIYEIVEICSTPHIKSWRGPGVHDGVVTLKI